MLVAGGGAWAYLRYFSGPPVPTVVELPLPPPKPPVKPPEPTTAAVTFETKPAGAEVYDGDFLIGVTPFTLDRPRGTVVELKFMMKDHRPQTRKMRFEATATVNLELERIPGDAPAPGVKEKPAAKEKPPPPDEKEKPAAKEKPPPPAEKEKPAAKEAPPPAEKEKPAGKEKPAAKEKPAGKEKPAPKEKPAGKDKPSSSSDLKDLPF